MRSSAARFEVVAGNAAGMTIVVEDELIIGRHADGAGRLAEDEEISRVHARLTVEGSGFCAVEDLGSTNGTFVNGLRISAPKTLSEGDTIELGGTTLVVREVPGAETIETDQPTSRPRTTPGAVAEAPAGGENSKPPDSGPLTPAGSRAPAVLSVQLEVDFVTREARLFLDNASEPVRLVFDGVAWRAAASPNEKGSPA